MKTENRVYRQTMDKGFLHHKIPDHHLSIAKTVSLTILSLLSIQYYKITKKQGIELKRLQEMVNQSRNKVLSNMSHDIRTPLNAIIGLSAIAANNLDNKEQVRGCLRKIMISGKYLLVSINNILELSMIENGKIDLKMDSVSLREVMENIVHIIQSQVKEKNQRFDISVRNIVAETICCDELRLTQVLINILENAVKFTPEEGSIQVLIYEEESLKGEDYICVHWIIKDTGIGMSEDYQKRIFESFSREDAARIWKNEGIGLGLTITHYILDAMQGRLFIDSKPKEGSEFHVVLDLKKGEIMEEEMILPNWNMLVVDSDFQAGDSIMDCLKTLGILPEFCSSVVHTFNRIEERHKNHQGFDIILLNLQMPELNGFAAAREIRRIVGTEILILLTAACDWNDIEEDAKASGINGFIPKPLFKSSLYCGLKFYVRENENREMESISKKLYSKRILLAEDNDLNWEIAEDLLSELGLKLERAENGKAAVEMFENSKRGYYDAILMDLRMPVMNGYEAVMEIRSLDRKDADLPIFALSADAFDEDIRKCLNAGMNGHLAKPIDIAEVSRLLEKYLK